MYEIVELLSGRIVAELLYLRVGDLAASFHCRAQRGIIIFRCIVPGVTALVEDDGVFSLVGILASTMTQANTGRRYCTSTAYLGIGFSPLGSSNAPAPANFCQQGR